MPEYTRENYLKLRDLVNSGQLDDTRLRKAQNYMRQYLALNPQEAQSDLETVQRAQGTQVGTSGLDFTTPQPSAREQFGLGKEPESTSSAPANLPENAAHNEALARYTAAHNQQFAPMGPGEELDAQQQERAAKVVADTEAAHQIEQQTYDTFAKDTDPRLAQFSESGVKGFYRNPEAVAPPRKRSFGEWATTAQAPIYWSEPSFEDFQKAMQPMLGDAVYALKQDGAPFKVWKDAQYADAYDRAQASGLGIVRIEHAAGNKNHPWRQFAQHAQAAAQSGVPGFLRGATGGLSDIADVAVGGKRALAENQLHTEASPTAATVGNVAGTFTPGGAADLAFGGTAKAINKIPGVRQLETSTLGRLGMAGLKGGLGAEAAGGFEDASRAVAKAIANKDPRELLPNTDTLKRAGGRLLIGAGLGGGGELLGAGAGGLRNRLRDEGVYGKEFTRDVKDLDAVGARSTITGIKPTPEMQGVMARAKANPESPSYVEQASSELEQPLLKSLGTRQANREREAGYVTQLAINAELKKGTQAVPWNVIDRAIREEGKLRFSADGMPLPTPGGEGEAALGKGLNSLLAGRPRVMDWMEAEALVGSNPSEYHVYSPSELRRAGVEVTMGKRRIPLDQAIVLRGKLMNVEDANNALGIYEKAAKQPPATVGAAIQAGPTSGLHEEFRKFVANNFPLLDRAKIEVSRGIGEQKTAHALLNVPEELTTKINPDALTERGGLTPRAVDVQLEGKPLIGFQQGLRSRASKDQRTAQTAAAKYSDATLTGGNETQRALSTLREALATEGLRKTQSHIGATVSTSGVRAYEIGRPQALLLRADSILAKLERMPGQQQDRLVRAVKGLNASLSPALKARLAESNAAAEEAMRLTREYGSSTPLASDMQMTPERIAEMERNVYRKEAPKVNPLAKTPVAGENFTPEPAEFRPSGAGKHSPELVARIKNNADLAVQLKDALVRWGNAQKAELAQRKADQAPGLLTNQLPRPGASIRGGRPGRAASAYGQNKASDLTPEEMRLLMLILEAQPSEEKPKEVAAK